MLAGTTVQECNVDINLETFAGQISNQGRSERTVRAYCQDVRSFAAWFEQVNQQPFEMGLINSVDLRAWREYSLGTEAVSPSTWNRRRASMRVLVDWLMAMGVLTYDPMQGVEKAKQVELPPRWLTRGELMKVLRQCELNVNGATTEAWKRQAVRDQAMIALMAYAGLREGELVALDVSDVEIRERSGKVVIRRGKGDKRREVPLNREARRAVSCWLELIGADAGPCALFIGKRGRVTTRTVQRRVAEIGRQAGVELTPHDLRHTFAKRMVDGNVALTTIQKLLGHARLETTARYVQPGWSDFEQAVEVL